MLEGTDSVSARTNKHHLRKNVSYQLLSLGNLFRVTHELHHPSGRIWVCIHIPSDLNHSSSLNLKIITFPNNYTNSTVRNIDLLTWACILVPIWNGRQGAELIVCGFTKYIYIYIYIFFLLNLKSIYLFLLEM